MRHGRFPILLALVTGLLASAPVQARPAHKQALADYFGPFLARKLNDCRTCHLPDAPGASQDAVPEKKPHNPFGARLKSVRKELRRAGKKTDLITRLEAVLDEDSDGDGVSNLLELLSGHFPGDPDDRPTPNEVAEARQTLRAFVKYRSSYPWRPFETVKRPPVPKVKNAGWVRNPIDAFIAAEHEARGLTPRPEAGKAVLLRRVYLDLIGLPPTPEELHAFLNDHSPDAYEQVVDRLLDSPHHGERWGRHWMDVWRYSDWAGWTDGGQIRDSQPHVWRWRDWIVESLNADKGYDRMILEMLAGDELAPDDPQVLRATGYLVRNYKMLSREKWLQDTVEHTSMAFLGVTLGCARCHDHMFDPILQKEYYQVRAVFEPHQVRIDRRPGQPDTKLDGVARVYDADLQAPTFLFIRGDDRNPDRSKAVAPGVPAALGGRLPKVEPVELPATASRPDRRPFVVRETVQASAAAVASARAAAAKARGAVSRAVSQLVVVGALPALVRAAAAAPPHEELAVAESALALAQAKHAALLAVLEAEDLEDAGQQNTAAWKQAAAAATESQRRLGLVDARHSLLLARHAQRVQPMASRAASLQKLTVAEKALAQAEAAAQAPPTTAYTKRPIPQYPHSSTGRRLAFARWIADRRNPLTARVAMNHIWLRHFGEAIVPSVFDFGRNGRQPSHPALLDWLATEFMDRGWSMKAVHRLIVTSSTYRMASTPDARDLQIDTDNRYLWRMPSRRMEAELVRDCVYYVAGKLDLTMGGKEIDYRLGLEVPRRSLYFQHAQEKQVEFLKLFDCAAVTECYQRKESILPQQALALANSRLTREHARVLARSLASQVSDPAVFSVAAFERVLSRAPTAEELRTCVNFLQQRARRLGGGTTRPVALTGNGMQPADAASRAREELVHVLLNHNDFVTIR
jgi:hypothetical protein